MFILYMLGCLACGIVIAAYDPKRAQAYIMGSWMALTFIYVLVW